MPKQDTQFSQTLSFPLRHEFSLDGLGYGLASLLAER